MTINVRVRANEDSDDFTAPYHELEAFDSIRDALQLKHIRKRVPACFNKTLHNRYMVANLVYLSYTTALLVIDFHPNFTASSSSTSVATDTSNETISLLDHPVIINEYVNRIYIGNYHYSLF
jgi:hypothetical protein